MVLDEIDSCITSDNIFHQVPTFIVKPQSLISDHCQIVSWLKTPTDLRLKCKQFYDTYNWKKLQPKFHWNSQSNSKFRDALNLSVCTKKISDFLGENFDNSLNGVEKANRTFTDILITAAKTSLKQKRNTVSKHKKIKEMV